MTHRHDPASGDCREIFSQLSEYLDDELQADLCGNLEEHLDDCPPCQAFLRSLRRTVEWVRDDDAPKLPDEVRRSIREAYRRYRETRGDGPRSVS